MTGATSIPLTPAVPQFPDIKKWSGAGKISLVNATAASGIHSIDMGITNNGQFLYALDPPAGGIDMFKIAPDGSLTSMGTVAGGFAIFAQGIAVR